MPDGSGRAVCCPVLSPFLRFVFISPRQEIVAAASCCSTLVFHLAPCQNPTSPREQRAYYFLHCVCVWTVKAGTGVVAADIN